MLDELLELCLGSVAQQIPAVNCFLAEVIDALLGESIYQLDIRSGVT